jgi:LacI family transcriptional regulator
MLATEHLISLGHTRIAHLMGRADIVTTAPRTQGYRNALKTHGIEPDPRLCVIGDFNKPKAYEETSNLLKLPEELRPTAIFAANDLSGHGAIDAIHDAGLRVPEDVAVVGYDDTWYAEVTRPALTSVNMDAKRLGAAAASELIAYLDSGGSEGAHHVMSVSLTIRESCGSSSLKDANKPPGQST